MRKLFYLTVFILLVPVIASAGPYLVCDCQDNVEFYIIAINGGAPIQSMAVDTDCADGQKRLGFDLAPLGLADGQHSLTVKAANVWEESTSVPFDFKKAVPSDMTGIGLKRIP